MSSHEVRGFDNSALGSLASWSIVQGSFVRSANGQGFGYLIENQTSSRCAVVFNGKALCAMPTGSTYRIALEERRGSPASVLHPLSSYYAEPSPTEFYSTAYTGLESGAGEDFSGVNPEEVRLFLSPDGKQIVFQFYADGERFICINGKCAPAKLPLCDVRFSLMGGRKALLFCDGLASESYILDSECYDSRLLDCEFTQSGKYFFSVQEGNARISNAGNIDLAINGDVLFSVSRMQLWQTSGATESEGRKPRAFLLDPSGRAVAFGFWEESQTRDGLLSEPTIGILTLGTGKVKRYPGYEILDARISPLDTFEFICRVASEPAEICELNLPIRH